VGTTEAGGAIQDRPPAVAYLDGANWEAFYRAGRAVQGRPYVMVHKGERTRARVGPFSAIGPDVVLMVGGNHPISWVTTFSLRELYDLPGAYEGNPTSRGDIDIGADVTIGRGARVLSGVSVGHGAVISPLAVVTKDVRPFAVVEGSPARETARRFSDVEVDRLLGLAWWEWPAARILEELDPPDPFRRALHDEIEARKRKVRRSLVDLRRARRLAGWALRGAAARIDPPVPPLTPSDFPTRIWSYPTSVFEMGWGVGGGCPPIVHHDGSGRTRATVGNYCSLAYDAELVLDGGSLPSPLSAVALGLDPAAGRAVVAAYAVVTEDVRPFAVVAGNPAREVSRRFDDDIVEALLAIAWWNWPEELVRERGEDLASPDLPAFIERYRDGV